MNEVSEPSIDYEVAQIDAFPSGLSPGATVLIAGTIEPATYAVGLQALSHYSHTTDSALVVTTMTSAKNTRDTYTTICPKSDQPSLAFVDTISEHQYVTAPYNDTPVVFVPSPNDLERIVMALSELTDHRPFSVGTRHLLIQSLTPLLTTTSTDRVCMILDRITGLQSETGQCFLSIDYTAHDEATMTALLERVDGVLWVTNASSTHLECEFRPTSGQHGWVKTAIDSED